jgi:predicted metal-dependent phosphoesterase TrpH
MYSIDFHTHTYHSFDSMMKPENILRIAKERRLNGIVISDHDTIKGGLECAALNKDRNFKVIVASEIKTDVGDITALNIKTEITARNFSEVAAETKRQGGLVLLVHPYHHHKLDEINFDAIDLVEGFNAREFPGKNKNAEALAKLHGKPVVAGSDSHVYGEIGNARTFYDDLDDLTKPIRFEGKQNNPTDAVRSQLIKAWKKKSPKRFYQWGIWAPAYLYKRYSGKEF